MKIIAGLGNPGKKYEKTRHNAGFITLESLADKEGLKWKEHKKVDSWTCEFEDKILAKPRTFMNNSGIAIRSLLSYYKLLPRKLKLLSSRDADLTDVLTVIHDDIDLPLGKYRISQNSGSGGHKGVQSIIDHIKTKRFTRIRVGINTSQKGEIPTPAFVLQKFKGQEEETMNKVATEIISKEL